MKLLIATLLILTALGGCAITTAPSTTSPAAARDRSSGDCRGVWDNLANACIGG
jgi:hypothetical protein